MTVLKSKWGSLNENLIAKLFPVSHAGGDDPTTWVPVDGGNEVWAPISDSNLETTLQWNSPFEAIGASSKLPLLTGLLQSGAARTALSALAAFVGNEVDSDLTKQFAAEVSDNQALRNLEGTAGITRLNSTQIFSGMLPLTITMTMHFRAWDDPVEEVQQPIDQLMEWGLPQELSKQGFIQSLTAGKTLLRSLFPSRAPQVMGFSYAGMTVLPVVIESMAQPITTRRDSSGARLMVSMPMKIATLAAIDKSDWKNYRVR